MTTKPKVCSEQERNLEELATQIKALRDEVRELRQDWHGPPEPELRSNSRCLYIHGRGWIPRDDVEW